MSSMGTEILEAIPEAEPGPGHAQHHDAHRFGASFVEEVEAAIAAMPWLTDADRGTVMLCRGYAAAIDAVLCNPEFSRNPDAVAKALYLGPQLQKALGDLGGNPTARGEFRNVKAGPGRLTDAQRRLKEFQENAAKARGAS